MSMLSEKNLLDAKNGDSSAIELVMTECYNEVYHVAKLTVNNETDHCK